MRWVNPMMLVALVLGCGGDGGTEVCREPSTWTVQGETIPKGVEAALAVARDASPCALPRFGGTVTFQLLPFLTEGGMVDGWVDEVECNPRMGVTTWAQPAEGTALVHELGHVLWVRCGLATYDQVRSCHLLPFLRWVWEVNQVVASSLGHELPGAFVAPSWACPEEPGTVPAR